MKQVVRRKDRGYRAAGRGLVSLMLMLALGLSGCAYKRYRDAAPPQISVANIALAGVSIFEQKFSVDLRMRNPNDFALPVRGMEYKLRLNGIDFATGVSPSPVTLPAYGEQVVSVAVYSNVLNSLTRLQELTRGSAEALPYEVVGHLKLEKMPVRIPFRYAGQFDVSRFLGTPGEGGELKINERTQTP